MKAKILLATICLGVGFSLVTVMVFRNTGTSFKSNESADEPHRNLAADTNEAESTGTQSAAISRSSSAKHAVYLEAFADWLNDYRVALGNPSPRAPSPEVIDEGIRLAKVRRPVMVELIQQNPRPALASSLKWHEWAALPEAVKEQVEEPFSARADWSVYPDCRGRDGSGTPWHAYYLDWRGQDREASVFGRRTDLLSKNAIPVQGIALNGKLALWESPAYRLSAEELPAVRGRFADGNNPGRSWLTGKEIDGASVAALVGGRIHYFATDEELQQVTEAIATAEKMPGPNALSVALAGAYAEDQTVFVPQTFVATALASASTWTDTSKRVLGVRLTFTDKPNTPYTEAAFLTNLGVSSNLFYEMSFRKTGQIPTVTSVLNLPNDTAYYQTNGQGTLRSDARTALANAGYVIADYDIFIYSTPSVPGRGANAELGGDDQYLYSSTGQSVIVHETGHNYGIAHANFWVGTLSGGDFIERNGPLTTWGPAANDEYGDLFDIMAVDFRDVPGNDPVFQNGHFAMSSKSDMNWIEPEEVWDAQSNGVYRVYRFDDITGRDVSGNHLALKFQLASGQTIWAGLRRNFPQNGNLSHGAYIVWDTGAGHRQLDTTPLSRTEVNPNPDYDVPDLDRDDAALAPGETWTAPDGSVRLTNRGFGGAAPHEYLDLEVEFAGVPPVWRLFTTPDKTIAGLTGSYVDSNLRSRAAPDDWRTAADVTISGTRMDDPVDFSGNDWGSRAEVGITGGSDADWDNYSVQWDGVIEVNGPMRLATRSDDSSRMWIDLDKSGSFEPSELIDNNWGNGQGATTGPFSVQLAPDTYSIRIQYEEGGGGNSFRLIDAVSAEAVGANFEFFTDAAFATNGLIASYVNQSLRTDTTQDDWRSSQTISGSRLELLPLYWDSGMGTRADVGLTGGTDGKWQEFSAQYDGWIRIYKQTRFITSGADGARFWIDLDGNGSFDTASPEYTAANWGEAGDVRYAVFSDPIPPGDYRVRIQREQGSDNYRNRFLFAGVETDGHYALNFDGSDDYVVVDRPVENNFTIEFWMRTTQVAGDTNFWWQGMGLVDGEVVGVQEDFGVSLGQGLIIFGNGTGGTDYSIRSGFVADGFWHHLAATREKSSGEMKLYVDGVEVASGTGATTTLNSPAQLRIGSLQIGNNFFEGWLDEVRIWNSVRSATQIAAASRSRTPQSGNLVAGWHFDDGEGTTAADFTGHGVDGNLNNEPNWVASTAPVFDAITNVVTALDGSGPGSFREALDLGKASDSPSVITFDVTGTISFNAFYTVTTSTTILGPGRDSLWIRGWIPQFQPGTSNYITGVRLGSVAALANAIMRNRGILVMEDVWYDGVTGRYALGGGLYNTGSLFVTNCELSRLQVQGEDGVSLTSTDSGGGGGGGGGMGGALFLDEGIAVFDGCLFRDNNAFGGNGGDGGEDGSDSYAGGNGGRPNRGNGGAQDSVGGDGDFGGGGGGGGGTDVMDAMTVHGGMGGFGGGGGGAGAARTGGNGGMGGSGGTFAGAGGSSSSAQAGGGGGGAGMGGAIFARSGQLTVINCAFENNLATNGVGGFGAMGNGNGEDGQGVGGAIFNLEAKVILQNATFTNNIASTADDDLSMLTLVTTLADSGYGSLRQAIGNAVALPDEQTVTFAPELSGGIVRLTSGQIDISNSVGSVVVDASSLPEGITVSGEGAFRIAYVGESASVTFDSLVFTNGNTTESGGAAILNKGETTVRNSTFAGNSTTQHGGAIRNLDVQARLTLEHCTLTQNESAGYGGAMESDGSQSFIVRHCTVVSNTATGGGGCDIYFAGQVVLEHTIVAGNTGSSGPDILETSSSYAAQGHNLIGDGTDSGLTDGVDGNLVGVATAPIDPLLGTLRLNGGSTPTLALLGGSPARDAGDPLFNGYGLTDQRGYPRVVNGRVDIGAVESCLMAFYTFDSFTHRDETGASTAAYQGGASGPWYNRDHRGVDDSAIALNDPGFGTDNYYQMTTPHDPTNSNRGLGLQGDFTVSAWVLVKESNEWNIVLGNTGPLPGSLVLGLNNMTPYYNLAGEIIQGTNELRLNRWTHLACTYDSFGGQMALYVDGVVVASSFGQVNSTKDADLLIGFSEGLTDSNFRGFIDEFAVFCAALSPNQIAALAQSTEGLLPTEILPEPALPGPALSECGWSVREIYAHPTMPDSLVAAESIANSPELGTSIAYPALLVNFTDPEDGAGGWGFFGGETPFAVDNLTPDGMIDGDDNDFVLIGRLRWQIPEEDDYTLGFSGDDGSSLRVKGAVFTSSTRLSANNPANPAHRGDTLRYPGNTANSQTLGVLHLEPGSSRGATGLVGAGRRCPLRGVRSPRGQDRLRFGFRAADFRHVPRTGDAQHRASDADGSPNILDRRWPLPTVAICSDRYGAMDECCWFR